MSDWNTEYYRRVTKILVPDHYEHGFRVDADHLNIVGSDAYIYGDDEISVAIFPSPCPCGEQVRASADTPEQVAFLLQRLTEENPDA